MVRIKSKSCQQTNYASISDLMKLSYGILVSGWTVNSPSWPYLGNSIFLFLLASSAASASCRLLPFYHATTRFSPCIIKAWLLQCGAGWTFVYDTWYVAASSQCCSLSRRWSLSSGPRDRTNEEAPLVTNQIPYQFQVMSDDARRCDAATLWRCDAATLCR